MSANAACASLNASAPRAGLARSPSQESLLGLEGKDKYVIVTKSKLEALEKSSASASVVKLDVVPQDLKSDVTDGGFSKPLLLRAPRASTISSGLKTRLGKRTKMAPIELIIPYSLSATTAASGLLTSTLSVDPSSNATEWASLTALYDEYKVISGEFHFGLVGRCQAPGTSGLTVDSNFVVVFDPNDPNSLSSWRNGTEYSQHLSLFPTLITAGATAAADVYGIRTASTGVKFPFHVPRGAALATSSGAINYGGDVWFQVGSTVPCGQLKFYWQTANTTTATAVNGVVYLRVHLRSRA